MDSYVMIPALLLLAIMAALTPTSSAVQCYICSWSPKDENNRTDYCTTKNFEPRVAHINDCELGCEVFVQWDKNDLMEQWRRNCIQKESRMTGACVQDEDRARRWRHCTCDSSLCNSAPWRTTSALAVPLCMLSRLLV